MNDIPFVYEIAEYLANNSATFDFGTGNTNLKIGELIRGESGVNVTTAPGAQPDMYTDTQYATIDFFARHPVESTTRKWLAEIYRLFHQKSSYTTTNYQVYFSHAAGQPDDLDRDGEGSKVLRLSVIFIIRSLIS